MSDKQTMSSTVLDTVDNSTRDAVIRLNQKLINLEIEITAKLALLEGSHDKEHETQKKNLLILKNEVERALKSIDDLVNMVVSDQLTDSEFLALHHDELENFREMVTTNADKIAKINEKLR
jgi:hypothetical protein